MATGADPDMAIRTHYVGSGGQIEKGFRAIFKHRPKHALASNSPVR